MAMHCLWRGRGVLCDKNQIACRKVSLHDSRPQQSDIAIHGMGEDFKTELLRVMKRIQPSPSHRIISNSCGEDAIPVQSLYQDQVDISELGGSPDSNRQAKIPTAVVFWSERTGLPSSMQALVGGSLLNLVICCNVHTVSGVVADF